MTTVRLTPDAVQKLKKHYADGDPRAAAIELSRQGVPRKVIGDILERSERTVFRYLKDGGLEVEVDRPAGPVDEDLVLSYTEDGFYHFYEAFSEWGPLPEHCKAWVRAYFQNPQLLLSVAPGHLKSTVFSVWLPTYEIVCDRKVRILLVSKSADLSIQWVRSIADLLQDPRVAEAFGDFAPAYKSETVWKEGTGLLQVKGGDSFTVLARGSQQQILGYRANRIFVDDPTSVAIASSPTEREREFNYYVQEVFTRLEPDGRMVVVGQRVHPKDLYGALGELEDELGKVFHWEKYPAVIEWPGQDAKGRWVDEGKAVTLYPAKWPWAKLKAKLRVMGRTRFDMMYQGIARPLGGGLFSTDTLALAKDERAAFEGYREKVAKAIEREGLGRANPVVRVLSLDPSPNAYAGLTLADVVVDRKAKRIEIWVMALWRFQTHGDASQRQDQYMRVLRDTSRKHRVDVVITESSSFWDFLKGSPWWVELFDPDNPRAPKHIKQLTTKQNTYHTEYGLQSLESDCETGMLHLPFGDGEAKKMYGLLEDEVANYEVGSGKGGLDDILKSLWFIKAQWHKLRPKHPGGLLDNFGGPGAELNASGRMMAQGGPGVQRTPAQWRQIHQQQELAESAWQEFLDRGVTEEELEELDARDEEEIVV